MCTEGRSISLCGERGGGEKKTGYTVNRKPLFTLTGAGTFHGALKGDISLYAVVEKEKKLKPVQCKQKACH